MFAISLTTKRPRHAAPGVAPEFRPNKGPGNARAERAEAMDVVIGLYSAASRTIDVPPQKLMTLSGPSRVESYLCIPLQSHPTLAEPAAPLAMAYQERWQSGLIVFQVSWPGR